MKTVVIGGGPAGMISAYFQAKNGNSVTLIEKNEKLGKKLYITGKGRCNITNDCDVQTFLANVVSNPKFLMSSIYSFTPQDTINFFEEIGLKTKVERGNRVFPFSDKSSDVIKVLKNALERVGVIVKYNEVVLDVLTCDGAVNKVITDLGEYDAEKVIIATGGLSYASTGSTGDGYAFAKKFGHTVTKLTPSLCGFNLKGEEFKALQGLTLKNVKLTAKDSDKEYYSEQGEMLFTHFGVSGPLVLTASALTTKRSLNNINLFIDLKPALTLKELDTRLLRDFEINKNKALKNSLDLLLPKALIPLIINRSGVNEYKKNNEITVKERTSIITTIKALEFKLDSLRSFNEAVITNGGVMVKEVNPSTMESRLVKGLFFAGEVLDLDAFTGGFNLQIAFSTGYTAGNN